MKQRLRCRKKLEAEWDAYIDELAKSADLIIDLTDPAPPSGAEVVRHKLLQFSVRRCKGPGICLRMQFIY